MPGLLLVAHAAATWFMVGLSSTIQWVHYPLFRHAAADWRAFHDAHTRRMGAVLLLPWSVEGLTALMLPFVLDGADQVLAWVGLVALVAIAGLTAFRAVPAHQRLGAAWDPTLAARLLRVDRARWALWLLRGAVAVLLLV